MTPSTGGHAPRREVFVYWKLPRAALGPALEGTGVFQQAMTLAAPGLQARLLVRGDDDSAGFATLMETYALPGHPGGIGDALLERLRTQGDAATAEWRTGTRHFELFTEPARD